MGKKILDIKVYVEDDHVYMSTHDWMKIVKVLENISYDWSVSEEKEEDPKVFIGHKVH
jgi:hypothetical protein